MSTAPIGIFDSGVGGLSVLRAIREQHPTEDLLYLADQAHVPYGPRPMAEVRTFACRVTEYLLDRGSKMIVVACNTASAAALADLRQTYSEVPFIGMEPAVKPAAEHTETGVVGVLATPATFQGELYASVVERFASGVRLLQNTCVGLVPQIEAGKLEGEDTAAILVSALKPMLAANIDTVVLGCTHYPFVIPLIRRIVGENVRIIDPAPAIARQVGRLLEKSDLANPDEKNGETRYLTTGRPAELRKFLRLTGFQAAEEEVQQVSWIDGVLLDQASG